MLGKDKKEARPVGATDKLKRAQKLKAMGYFDTLNPAQQGGTEARWQSTLAIFVLALILAWLLTDGPIRAGRLDDTGIALLDGIVFSPTTPTLLGVPLADFALILLIRGLLIWGAAGFLPLVSWLWAEIIDRPLMNAYRTVWGVTLGLAVIALGLKPVFAMIGSNFAILLK